MFKRRTRSLVLLCCGFFCLGFTSILIPSTHATGYSQSIPSDLSPLLTSTPCPTPTPSPTPAPTPSPTPSPTLTPTPPLLRVSLHALSFSAPVGGPNPTPQLILIMNAGGGQLDWTATVSNGTPGILSIYPSLGSGLAGGATGTITVAVYTQVLAAGTYTSKVTISAVDPATGQPVAGSPSNVNIVSDSFANTIPDALTDTLT
jgi:hypothetical protein